jgi:hypothetical protein
MTKLYTLNIIDYLTDYPLQGKKNCFYSMEGIFQKSNDFGKTKLNQQPSYVFKLITCSSLE